MADSRAGLGKVKDEPVTSILYQKVGMCSPKMTRTHQRTQESA